MMQVLAEILLCVLFCVAAVPVVYLFVAALAGRLIKKPGYSTAHQEKKRIAVLITSHREDEVIVHTARRASSHDYPKHLFDVFLAADHLQPATIEKLQKLDLFVSVLAFESGSKARSLNHLLNSINEDRYDIAVVLDGDNIMTSGFLEKINSAFQHSFKAAQGHRIAKNINTPVAILDALSEEINNHLFRKAQRSMGLSSATIGSGMAFEFKKLKAVYNKPGILDNPACDREVDFEMMKANVVVEYIESAWLLDEKVSKNSVFQKQRRRWLESQLFHLGLFFSTKERVANKTKDYWNKLFINLIPPRIIFAVLFAFIFFLYLLLYVLNASLFFPPLQAWLTLFAVYVASMLLSIPKYLFTRKTLLALAHLPLLMFSFLKALTGVKARRKEFAHTPKTFTTEEHSD